LATAIKGEGPLEEYMTVERQIRWKIVLS